MGLGNGLFKARTRYLTTQQCQALELVDLNGDRFLDVVAACGTPGTLNVILGKANGTFGFSQDYTALGGIPIDVVTGDFNGDGKIDAATVDSGLMNVAAVEVWLGDGAGGFGGFAMSKVTSAGGRLPKHLAAADFNGDGKLDVALTANSDDAINVLLGKGDGTFGAAATIKVAAGRGASGPRISTAIASRTSPWPAPPTPAPRCSWARVTGRSGTPPRTRSASCRRRTRDRPAASPSRTWTATGSATSSSAAVRATPCGSWRAAAMGPLRPT